MAREWPETTERERRLDEVIGTYLEAAGDGMAPRRQALLQAYPDLAGELAEFFADQDRVASWAGPLCQAMRAGQATAEASHDTVDGRNAPAAGAPGPFLGDYELLGELGRGGMGIVYRARQRSLNRLVALKVVRAHDLACAADGQRFRNEAETVAALDHAHIVSVHEVGEGEGCFYFSMRLVEGGSLDTRLVELSAEPGRAARLVACVARAIHHAHQRGVLHRDLKPSNILLDGQGQPHVADFGLARRMAGDSGLTQTGALVGTPSYMAPEQTSGQKGAVTTATDVYGLGAVLYALLTGRPPFRGETVLDTLALVREGEPEPPRRLNPRVHRDLETICLHCLHKDPAKRYGSAEALANDLERWLQGKPIQARPVSRRERAWRWCRRNPLLAGLLALVVLGSVGSAVWIGQQMRQTQAEKQRAERNLDMAYQVLDELYIDQVGNRLMGQKELSADDRRFLERMRDFYQQFAEGNSRHPATRLKIAKAYRRLSDVHFRLSDYASADQANEHSVVILEKLAEEFPSETEYWRELVGGQVNWGHALLLSGRIREAEQAYRRAGELGEKRLASRPRDELATRAIASSSLNMGDVHAQLGQTQESVQASREAIRLCRELANASPDDPHYPRSWWNNLDNLRNVLTDSYRLEEIEQLQEEMQQLWQRRRSAFVDPEPQMHLADLHANRGFILRVRSQLKEAEKQYRQALTLLEPLSAGFPNSPDIAPRLAECHLQLGLVLQAAGKRDEAKRSLRQAVEPAERMLTRSPLPVYPSQVARIHLHLGELFQAAGRDSEAEKSYQQARKLLEKVAKDFPRRATDRSNLGSVLDREAQLCLAKGKAADAVALLEQAIGHHEAARRSNPKHPIYQQYLGLHWHVLGVALYRQGKWRAAVDTLEKGMALRGGGNGSDWFVLAMAHWHMGDKEQARKWYAQAVRWSEENQPGNAELRRFRALAEEVLKAKDPSPKPKVSPDKP